MLLVVVCVVFLQLSSWFLTTSSTSTDRSLTSTPELRRIPSDRMDWKTLREQNHLHADKTNYLEYMLTDELEHKFFFIHRPPGFGKSSFLKMIECFVRGEKSLFQGLKIYDQGNVKFLFNKRIISETEITWINWCPSVIHLDFGAITQFETMDQFENSFYQQLKNIDQGFNSDGKFDISELIRKFDTKNSCKTVILIDEYDAPFRQALYKNNNPKLAEKIKSFINTLLEDFTDEYKYSELRLVLVLGTSRLQMDSLKKTYVDLTFKKKYSGAFGFTNEEIENFQPEITHKFNLRNREEFDEFTGGLRNIYEGHNFAFQNSSKDVNVWNPVSIVKYLNNKTFAYSWISNDSMKEIIRKLYFTQIPLQRFENLKVSRKEIQQGRRNPAVHEIPIEILMFENGYLTISTYNEKTESITLKFPNEEIKTFLESEIKKYHPIKEDYILIESTCRRELTWHLFSGNTVSTMDALKCMFNTLAQEKSRFDVAKKLIEFIRQTEISYSESLKLSKDNSSLSEEGDVVVDVSTRFYRTSFAFKIHHSAILAIEKLIQYLDLYSDSFLKAIGNPKELFLVGMNFTAKTGGNLDQWISIPWKNGNLMYDQMKASSEGSIQEFHHNIKTSKNRL